MRAVTHAHLHGATLAVSAALVAAVAAPAVAHSPLGATAPRDGAQLVTVPRAVAATYGEPLAGVEDAVVQGPGGRREVTARRVAGDLRQVRISVPAAGPGTYRVAWVAVSADGHRSEARITFRVRPPAVSRSLLRLSARVRAVAVRVASTAPR